jgi:RimJ/RimL family protein N-acetyltransferase
VFHRSQRLLLRPPWPEDSGQVFGAIADEGVVRNLARAPWPYRSEDAREFVSRPFESRFPRFLIARADDAALIGCIGINPEGRDIELGYWIARDHWGQGYATEAGSAMIEIARMLGHGRMVASHFLDNPASGRVLHKLGFAPVGRIRPRYSRGRGEQALAAEYALELAGEEEPGMWAA